MWQTLTANDTTILGSIAEFGSQRDPRYKGLTAEMLSEWLDVPAGTRYGFFFDGGSFNLGLAIRFDAAKGRAIVAEMYFDGDTTPQAAFARISGKCREFTQAKELAAIYASRPLDGRLPMAALYAEVNQAPDLTVTVLRATPEVESLRIEFKNAVV